ncbi:hypothetical protein [Streptomyces sp. NPDC093094]|uniref:hypothetical protein n=1 Tax=Streptomyces sp. NPDC093094 TaxID=3366026 RepID=UPI0038270A1C
MRLNTVAALCLAATTAVVFTGCADSGDAGGTGSSAASSATAPAKPKEPFPGLTGGEIVDKAFEATTGAGSLRVKGAVQDTASGGAIDIDMALDKKGDCVGTLGMDGGTTDLIKTGDTVYMRYDETFLRAQMESEPKEDVEAAVDMLAGKWTKTVVKGSEAADVAAFCDLDNLLGDVNEGSSAATRGKAATVDGAPALTLREKDGQDRATLYVATEGEPYVLRLSADSAEEPVDLTFADYEKPVAAKKPAGEILDLDDLG